MHRLLHDRAALEAIRTLRQAGLPSVLLKGPITAARLYGDDYRSYLDIDLLVPPTAGPVAVTALRSLGFEVRSYTKATYDLRRASDGTAIDLHLSLGDIGADPTTAWRVLAGRTTDFALHGEPIRVLDVPAHAFHLALHVGRSGSRLLKPQVDLERGIRHFPLPVWQDAAALARRLDAVGAFTAGLRCFVASGDALADTLGLPRRPPLLRRIQAVDRTGVTFAPAAWRKLTGRQRLALLRRWAVPDRTLLATRLARDPLAGRLAPGAPYGLRVLVLRVSQCAGVAAAVRTALAPSLVTDEALPRPVLACRRWLRRRGYFCP